MVISLECADDVAVVRIRRPETKNSLTLEQIEELARAIENAGSSGARCLLVTGEAGSFCAGRDLRGVDLLNDDTYRIMTTLINPLLEQIHEFSVPTVAAVEGPALGLGFGLALCCDLVLAAEDARFGSPFRNFAGVPDSGTHYFLERRVGRHRALELIYTGRLLTGIEAAAWGLVNRAIPAVDLAAQSSALCREIAAGPTAAFTASKRILAQTRSLDEVLELEAGSMDAALRSDDAREGIEAFKQKRRPRFTGR